MERSSQHIPVSCLSLLMCIAASGCVIQEVNRTGSVIPEPGRLEYVAPASKPAECVVRVPDHTAHVTYAPKRTVCIVDKDGAIVSDTLIVVQWMDAAFCAICGRADGVVLGSGKTDGVGTFSFEADGSVEVDAFGPSGLYGAFSMSPEDGFKVIVLDKNAFDAWRIELLLANHRLPFDLREQLDAFRKAHGSSSLGAEGKAKAP